jgi:flagellar FliL protein
MTATVAQESRWATNGGKPGAAKPAAGSAKGLDAPEAAAPKAKRSLLKSKKLLIAVVAVLGLGGGGYTFLKPTPVVPPSGGTVVPLDATTLNLAEGHYLKIAVAVQLLKTASATDFETSHAAELVIDEFSNLTVASLSTNDARKKLTAELLTKIKKAYPEEVYDIFVTMFVMQ